MKTITALAASLLLLSVVSVHAFDAGHMLCLVNQERANAGRPNLGLDERLNAAAQEHCNYQAAKGVMSHGSTSTPGERMTRHGFDWQTCAENISFGQSSEEECMKEWMASPGHRENILGDFTHFGAAVSYDGPTPYFTQDFASDGQEHDFPLCPSGGDGGSAYGGGGVSVGGDDVLWFDENGMQVEAPMVEDTTVWVDDDGFEVAAPVVGEVITVDDDGLVGGVLDLVY